MTLYYCQGFIVHSEYVHFHLARDLFTLFSVWSFTWSCFSILPNLYVFTVHADKIHTDCAAEGPFSSFSSVSAFFFNPSVFLYPQFVVSEKH